MALLKDMVDINSFTRNPAGVNRLGEFTALRFADLGFDAERIESRNPAFGAHVVVSRPGTSGRKIGLVTHLDTVFPAEEEAANGFRFRAEGDRLYGPGTVDIKGGTVMIYMVMDALRACVPAVFEAITWDVLLDAARNPVAPSPATSGWYVRASFLCAAAITSSVADRSTPRIAYGSLVLVTTISPNDLRIGLRLPIR